MLFMIFAMPGSAENGPGESIITKIEITGNRIDDSIIRKNLVFKEGDTVNEIKIEKSRVNLLALGVFRSLEIRKEKDESAGGVKMIIDARDGWYFLPVPMFGSRGGVRYFGGALLEQNAFRSGERLSAFAGFQDSVSQYSLSAKTGKLSFSGAVERRSYTEYQYQDGAYNSQIITDRNIGSLEDLGKVVNSYNEDQTVLRLSAGVPLSEKLRGTASLSFNDIQYANALVSAPGDTGRINVLHLGVQYGRNWPGTDIAATVGRLFGLGMADLQEKIKPLPQTIIDYDCQASVEGASKTFGSDAQFGKVALSGSRSVYYTDRSRFSVSMKTGYGVNVPSSQLFVTDRRDGLLGVYAREFRGDKIVTANTAYHRSFFRDSHGQLNGEVFCEYAECFFDSGQGQKEGVGCNLTYQFWRFPLPLGFGYTYSLDDKDWKISAGFGGMF